MRLLPFRSKAPASGSSNPLALIGFLGFFLTTVPSFAQFAQYTPPGDAGAPVEDRKERLEQAMAEARFHLGPVRLDPWFGIKDVGYVDDRSSATGERTSQLSANAGAGLRAYLPTGSKLIWGAHFLPEYIWAEDPELRRTNGRAGVGLFAFFNRLTLELIAKRSQQLDVATPELLRRSNLRNDEVSGAAEIRVAGSLYVFGDAREARVENLVDSHDDPELAALGSLDRRERIERAGLRLKSRRGFWIGAGVERSTVDFESAEGSRSNAGTAPILEVIFPEGGRFDIAIQLAWRSLEPRGDSEFVPFDGLTGSLRLGLAGDRRLKPSLYGSRNLVYGLGRTTSYIESDRMGLALQSKLGYRVTLRAFAERGTDDYVGPSGGIDRSDDETGYGAGIELQLRGKVALQVSGGRERYTSNEVAGNRSLTVIRTGLVFGGSRSPWY